MTAVIYAGPHDEVFIDALGIYVARGDTVEVPDDVAGHPPEGDDLGSGLLAQVRTWHVPGDEPLLDAQDPGPDANVEDLLAYVDGDADRAATVRDREKAQSNPRKTLIAQLDDITG